jgi:type IV secretory pathway TrbD component
VTLLLIGHGVCATVIVAGFVVLCLLLLTNTHSMEDFLNWLNLELQVLAQAPIAVLLPSAYTVAERRVGGHRAAQEQLASAPALADKFERLSSEFYSGSADIPSIKGRFLELDGLQVRATCEPVEGKMPHDVYRCYSIQGLMDGLRIDAQSEMVGEDLRTWRYIEWSRYADQEVTDLAHFTQSELRKKLLRSNKVVQEQLDLHNGMVTGVVVAIVIAIAGAFGVYLWLVTLSVRRAQRLAHAGMLLLRRVSPPALVDNGTLTDLLFGTAVVAPTRIESAASIAFDHMPRAVLAVSLDHTIEDLNARLPTLRALHPPGNRTAPRGVHRHAAGRRGEPRRVRHLRATALRRARAHARAGLHVMARGRPRKQ